MTNRERITMDDVQSAMRDITFSSDGTTSSSNIRKFKKGDRVKIKKTSSYLHQNSGIGTINKSEDGGEYISVKFDDGYSNSYTSDDLELIGKKVKVQEAKKKYVGFKPGMSIGEYVKNILKSEKDKERIKYLKTFDNCILPKEVQETIEDCLTVVLRQDLFEDWGVNDHFEKGLTNSILLYGPPGTGKTMISESIASVLGKNLMRVTNAEIQSNVPGKTEKNITKIFQEATTQEAVIMLDECDSMLYNRDAVGMIMSAEINHFLQEIERHDGVVILTTNRLHKLDAALQRRIIAKVEIPMPTLEARKEIWVKLVPAKVPKEKMDIDKLSEPKLSGGEIKNAILLAIRRAISKNHPKVTMEHFEFALNTVVKAKENFDKTRPQKYSDIMKETSMQSFKEKIAGQ